MALDRSAAYPGRFETPAGSSPQGAFKNRTSPVALDGSYLDQSWANDLASVIDSLIISSGAPISGTEDNGSSSQAMQGLIEQVLGRASEMVEGASAVNAYIVNPQTNNQGPASYFDGMSVTFTPSASNTSTATANVSGLGVTTIAGSSVAGVVSAGQRITLRYNSASSQFDIVHSEFNATSQILQFGDIIVQWGLTGAANGTYNFNTTFPNEVLTIVGTPTTGGNSMAGLFIDTVTTSSFRKITAFDEGNAGSYPVRYIAVGR